MKLLRVFRLLDVFAREQGFGAHEDYPSKSTNQAHRSQRIIFASRLLGVLSDRQVVDFGAWFMIAVLLNRTLVGRMLLPLHSCGIIESTRLLISLAVSLSLR